MCTGDEVESRQARTMAEGYNMLHAGGDGRSNGVGIIMNVENSMEVVRVERWNGLAVEARSSRTRRAIKSSTGADGTIQSSTYWWCGNSSSGG